MPWVDGSASGLRQRLSRSETGGEPATVSAYNLQVGVTSYELDLFGRVRSLSHAALERFFATEEARRGAQLSLIAAVADAYLALAADRELQRLAEGTVESEEGRSASPNAATSWAPSPCLEASQARTTVERARVDAARYEGQVEQDLNLLTLLIGGPVDPALLPAGFDEGVSAAAALPIGLPSEVLLRRPDVLQAEHFLRGANADVGAARAAFFPRITLTGSAGHASADLDELFSGGTGIWSFLPRLTVPIFQGGRLRAGRRVAEVDRQAAVTEYERAIQVGFREVADALVRARSLARQRAAQAALTEAAGRAYELSRARYDSGRDSYLLALDSQRSHYFAQQGLIVLRLAEELNRVELYRSVGGGWRENSE